MLLLFTVIGSHKKPAEPVEPAVSDALPSQPGSSFAMATSYSDHVSTSSSILTTSGMTDGLAQSVTQGLTQSGIQSGAQTNVIDDVSATISSSAQGTNQIEVSTMSLSSGLTVAINSNVSISSNVTSGAMTTTMSSLEPFNLAVTTAAVSSQSQSPNMFAIGGASSNILNGTTGKMTPPPSSYTETADNKGVCVCVSVCVFVCLCLCVSVSV